MPSLANNQELIHLIQAAVDGELNADERLHLQALLEGSKDAQQLHKELADIVDELANVPSVDVPEHLTHRILNSLNATPLGSAVIKEPTPKPTKRWWWRSQPMPNFVLASLLLAFVAVGLFQIDTSSLSDSLEHQGQQVSGTMVDSRRSNSDLLNQQVLLDRLKVNETQIQGAIEVKSNAENVSLKIDLESDAPLQAKILIEGGQYIFLRNTALDRSSGSIFRDSSYIKAVGDQQINQTLHFKSLSYHKKSNNKSVGYEPITVELYRNGELVRILHVAVDTENREKF